MSEGGPSREKPTRVIRLSGLWIGVVAIVAVVAVVLTGVMLAPSISPIPTIRDTDADGVPDAQDVFPTDPNEWEDSDSDGVGDNGDVFPNDSTESRDSDQDGIGDNADFWDAGNGGLIVRIELFELIAGTCDFFSNCEPSFRLEVDYDLDGVLDVARRADFEDFLDTQPLVNPVSWTFDVPDDASEIDLVLFVFELDIGVDDEIDVHPDPDFIAGWVRVDSPFSYIKFVTQGDAGAVGRLTYSVEAIGA